MKKIGMVGAGIMASGMSQNFLKNGYEVHVWNRSPDRLKPLLESGAVKAASPKAVAQAADIVIECVSDDEASKSVWLGDEGILAGATPEKVLISAATISVDWSEELSKLCKEKDLNFLDMPLTGGRMGAESGQLYLLIGGEKPVVESVKPDLQAIARSIYHFGPNGSGTKFKLLINTLSAIHINAAAQAVELAKKAGLDPNYVGKAIMDEMAPASPATNLLFQGMNVGEDHLNFAVKWIEKDLRYAQAMAKNYDIEFDLLNDTQKDYEKAKQNGLSERDWTAIIEMYRDKS